MGHEPVTGTTYSGATVEALRSLASDLVREHYDEYGNSHSPYNHYTIRPGVVTASQAFKLDPYDFQWAQRIYSPDDVITKTVRVSFPITDLSDVFSYDTLGAMVESWAKETGKSVAGWSLADDVRVEGLPTGVTGRPKVVHVTSEGEVESFYGAFIGPRMVANGSTLAEAKKDAAAYLLANAAEPWNLGAGASVSIRKVTRRGTSDDLVESKVVVSRGKVHIDVKVESVRKGAQAAGWAVSLDCHF